MWLRWFLQTKSTAWPLAYTLWSAQLLAGWQFNSYSSACRSDCACKESQASPFLNLHPCPVLLFCRSCWEVSCVDSDFNDGYGAKCSRSNACYDTSKSVVIKIVDRWGL
jgi:hypothetical protein